MQEQEVAVRESKHPDLIAEFRKQRRQRTAMRAELGWRWCVCSRLTHDIVVLAHSLTARSLHPLASVLAHTPTSPLHAHRAIALTIFRSIASFRFAHRRIIGLQCTDQYVLGIVRIQR